MDNQALYLLIISAVFILLILIGGIVFNSLGKIAFEKTDKGAAKTFSLLLRRGNFLRIATVLLIVYAALAHSIISNGKINETVISVLSGIAGFVLGGMNTKESEE
ncbi:MAG: hypothetical protein MGF17_15910 [Trichodesmium sp. MAG_R04]|jgi:uncharacterized BrkB/YihY/UPF0761 family membrane protein|nr:hypothetical protein [Trichodesmium sp. MAG_R04]